MSFDISKAAFIGNGFVMVNDIDNAVDYVVRAGDSMSRAGRYLVDIFAGRHDVKKIIRPVGIKIVDNQVLVLASSQDSSYIALLGLDVVKHDGKGECDSLPLLALAGFAGHADGFNITSKGELMVVGFNTDGYSVNIINVAAGLQSIGNATVQRFHYYVPKQSERIKMSDPYGVGLTCVAVLVVFFALICIALILKAFGKAIVRVENRNANKAAVAAGTPVASGNSVADTAGDVYAAIATAIYLYNEELHDDEEGIITIQKVERAWTPWNAKFYNMNQYFNNRKQ